MKLLVDDRERSIIPLLYDICEIEVRRLTVGDYAIVSDDESIIIAVFERKTLSDLAASIKDGRMSNNDKLLTVRNETGCNVTYIIESNKMYPQLDKKFNGIPYKCLQGKLDSLMFKTGIQIIWTKDEKHTAERFAGLLNSKVLAASVSEQNNQTIQALSIATSLNVEESTTHATNHENNNDNSEGNNSEGNNNISIEIGSKLLQKKHGHTLDALHVRMLMCLPKINANTAKVILKQYTLKEIVKGEMDENVLVNLKYDSNFRLGERGSHFYTLFQVKCPRIQTYHTEKIISCINGITPPIAKQILDVYTLQRIVAGQYPANSISELSRQNTNGTDKNKNVRKIGPAIEKKIRLTFS